MWAAARNNNTLEERLRAQDRDRFHEAVLNRSVFRGVHLAIRGEDLFTRYCKGGLFFMMMMMVMIVRVIAYGLGIMHSCPALHLPSTLHSYGSCNHRYSLHFYNATNDLHHNYNTTFYDLTMQHHPRHQCSSRMIFFWCPTKGGLVMILMIRHIWICETYTNMWNIIHIWIYET